MSRDTYIAIYNLLSSKVDLCKENRDRYVDDLTDDLNTGEQPSEMCLSKIAKYNTDLKYYTQVFEDFVNTVDEPRY